MGNIAALLDDACRARERLGAAPGLHARTLADGGDWLVEDVLCTHRPRDAAFEEQHERYRVALVGAGTFECRSPLGRELLSPGSLLLGNASECFECGHEHAAGDRCLAFAYSRETMERLAFEAGVRGALRLGELRVPPLRVLAPLVAEACAVWAAPERVELGVWDEVALEFAAAAVRLAAGPAREPRAPRNAERGVVRAVRLIERDPGARLGLDVLAREAKLSRFHFVRAFACVTGLTPHQFVMRTRLRTAAVLLATTGGRVIDVALACGFGDVSNFNHAFRAEFGAAPRVERARLERRH